eukprot:1422502-Pyramimonas_sp.AAC.1
MNVQHIINGLYALSGLFDSDEWEEFLEYDPDGLLTPLDPQDYSPTDDPADSQTDDPTVSDAATVAAAVDIGGGYRRRWIAPEPASEYEEVPAAESSNQGEQLMADGPEEPSDELPAVAASTTIGDIFRG